MGHLPRIILLVVLVIFSLIAAFYTWRTQESLEGFSDEEAYSIIADNGTNYKMRIYVMKIFDALLKRKPTPDELDTYSSMSSETLVLNSVLEQYHVGSTSSVVEFVPNTTIKTSDESLDASIPVDIQLASANTVNTRRTESLSKFNDQDDSYSTGDPRTGMMCVDKKKILYDLKQITDRVNAFHDQFKQM